MDEDKAPALVERLRQLSFEDPLAAKRMMADLLDASGPLLDHVLAAVGDPSDSRVRQIIARAAQHHPIRPRVAPILATWEQTESDEFTLTAIRDALAGERAKSRTGRSREDARDQAATFKYLAERLRHRILNALPLTGLTVDDLADEVKLVASGTNSGALIARLYDLKTALRRLERAVDFTGDEAHFTQTPILLPRWVREAGKRYVAEFGGAVPLVDFGAADDVTWVNASPYLLDTIFTNLWNNARQACGDLTRIEVRGEVTATRVKITLLDEGPGLSAEDVGRAFKISYSSHSAAHRGRGHMEVAEAVGRLRGTVSVQMVGANGYRVVISLARARV